ncbi:MAG: VOC family protein [Prevotellaceae bacterium]|jgi:catechol 2,3-dioxygenase-like lactoylglutathione lyase family enzyme|nr:VOC family protein [Prevotellaceae bacterium]
MNRISVICFGVKNMEASLRFYRDGLDFQTNEEENNPKVVFFNTTGTKFELYPLELLVQDVSEANPPEITAGFSGVTLAYNVKSEAEVHEIIELARKAGAIITKEPQKVFWGGYHAYFADPDGYYWEVAYNPYLSFDENDMIIL